MPQANALTAILLGGGAATTFDLIYACIRNAGFGKPAVWTCHAIASGLLGQEAWQSGDFGAALGVATHYSILIAATSLHFAASRTFSMLILHPLACGALFGVLIYLFMNFVVLPLSAFPLKISCPPLRLLEGFASHAVFVGIPVALAIRRARVAQGPRPTIGGVAAITMHRIGQQE